MSARRFLACALLGALLASGGARAASSTLVDYTDLWWNPAESGWGAHVTLQADVVFLVLYVHDGAREPRFFVASDMHQAQNVAPGETLFTGTLYRSTGSPFAVPFDASRVSNTAVGNAVLRFTSSTQGVLSYTVDGVSVEKAITRNTLGGVSLAGTYQGGLFVNSAQCNSGPATPTVAQPGVVEVTHEGGTVTLRLTSSPVFADTGSCVFTGRYAQSGRLASILDGTYTCQYVNGPSPHAGAFEMSDVELTELGLFGEYRGTETPACVQTGRMGGVRRGYIPATGPTPEPQ